MALVCLIGDHEFNPFSDDPVPHSEPKLLTIKVVV